MSGRLLDKRGANGEFPFRYRPAASTDVRQTWAEARKRMEEEKAKRERIVSQLPKRTK